MAKITTSSLLKMKQQGEKISTITAYDASFAKLFDQAGIHAILIGDSLGMVLQGQDDTLPVSIDDMAYHTQSVKRGVDNTLVIADMPFMSYATKEQALTNAAKLMQSGASMIKMEGGAWLNDTISALVERGIPVCAHLGLTPQSVNVFGGFKVQGREDDKAQKMIDDAKALEAAGAQLLVLECIPSGLGKAISEAVSIPTIGIGAGKDKLQSVRYGKYLALRLLKSVESVLWRQWWLDRLRYYVPTARTPLVRHRHLLISTESKWRFDATHHVG